MKSTIVFIVMSLVLCSFANAQPWMMYVKSDNPDFFEISDAFKEHAKTRKPNFKGMKQFKRWEWFFESRVNDDGRIPAKTYWEAANEVNNAKRKDKGAANWEALGPFDIPLGINTGYRIGVGRVNCVEFHPTDPDTYWIGTPVGGVWKTTDNGNTWNTTTDNLISIGIGDIVVNPLNPDVVYIATGDRDASDIFSIGVLKSFDGGETWQTTGLSFDLPELTNVNEILIDPVDTNVLVAATSVGIYRTENSGNDWTLVSPVLNFKDMITQYGNFDIMLASTYNRGSGNTKVLRSTDGGLTWDIHMQFTSFLGNAERTAFGNTAADPNVFYAVSARAYYSNTQGFYKSTDAGETWELLSDENTPDIAGYPYPGMTGFGQSFYDLTVIGSPTNANEVLVGSVGMWRSTDGGNDWAMIQGVYPTANWIHVDFHEFAYNDLNGVLYVGCDGGIYRSENFGTNWTDISNGLQILQSYRIDAAPATEGYVVMGNQDNGSMRAMDGVFNEINGSDGTECIIDYDSPNTVYSSYIFGEFFRSENYGASWTSISPPGQSGNWLTPLAIDPNDHETIYAGYSTLWKSENKGASGSWEQISGSFGNGLHRIDIAKSNSDVIYVSTTTNIWKTTDGGSNWENIKHNLPSGFYTDIEVSPVDENVIWVSFGQFNADNKVFVSQNGGLTWDNVTLGLPNLPVNCLLYDRNTSDGMYIGNDAGVYYKNNAMADWELFSDNLPNVIVTDLSIQQEINTLVAGTYGRGIWTSNTYYTDELPVAGFEADYSLQCSGKITFINKTTAYFDAVSWEFGDGGTSEEINPSHIYAAAGSYDVTLTVFKGGDEYQSTETINISEIMEAPTTTDGYSCGEGEVNLSASGSDNIYWFDNEYATEVIGEGNEFTTPSISETTTYYAANGTDESCLSVLSEAVAEIFEKPVSDFSYDIQSGNTVEFTNESNLSSSYLWDFGDGNQSTDENPVHQYAAADNYLVKLYANSENCVDSSEQTINLLSLAELKGFKTFDIYPNPSKGQFSISLNSSIMQSFSMRITDMKGKQIWERDFKQFIGEKELKVDLSDYSKGIYFIKIETVNNAFVQKVVIE